MNAATIRVLASNGWRVVVPDDQTCCGALAAHNGHLATARKLARRNAAAFSRRRPRRRERGRMRRPHGRVRRPGGGRRASRARRDGVPPRGGHPRRRGIAPRAHARRLPRRLSRAPLPGHPSSNRGSSSARSATSSSSEIPNGDRCCGAAGIYNVTEPEMSGRLMREKAEAVVSTGATVVASAQPRVHDADPRGRARDRRNHRRRPPDRALDAAATA